MSEQTNSFAQLWTQLKEYGTMKLEYYKLTAAEKVSLLITTIALSLIVGALCVVALFFVSMAVVCLIATGVGFGWAFMIVAGFYVLVLGVVVVFRKQLILNPVCRFVSKLLLS